MPPDCPEFIEAIRLIRRFFPETKPFISAEKGIYWGDIWRLLYETGQKDFSYDPRLRNEADLGLIQKLYPLNAVGDDEVYRILLEHMGLSPQGRAVVVPDAGWRPGRVPHGRLPFICHSRTVATRLRDYDDVFQTHYDTLFAFESGEMFLLNHDQNLLWGKSK